MGLKCLAVDCNLDIAGSFIKEWAKRGVTMERVDTMTEAIVKLMHDDYIFVGINGDVTDFMPFLKEMRSVTDIPIMIVTSNFDTQTEIAALSNGANLYARWHDTPEDNVSSVLAHIDRITEERKTTRKLIYCKGILMALAHRTIFVCNEKVALPRHEYDVLQLLMLNRGIPHSYEEIYVHVWGHEYKDEKRELLRNTISRLRRKLWAASKGTEFIATERDYGYSFISDNDK